MGYGSENLVILQKLEDAIEYAYCVFRKFPKSERFTAIADAVRAHVQSCFDREAELLPLIDATETPDDLEGIVW